MCWLAKNSSDCCSGSLNAATAVSRSRGLNWWMSWRPLGPLAPNIISMGVLLLGVEWVQAALWGFR